eukprot:2782392-Lingulodinium_polyedra.AAC.1
MRSAPESFKQPPAAPQLVTLALRTRNGPGCDASPTRRFQLGPCPPAAIVPGAARRPRAHAPRAT